LVRFLSFFLPKPRSRSSLWIVADGGCGGLMRGGEGVLMIDDRRWRLGTPGL
jgi:hypothetical protein